MDKEENSSRSHQNQFFNIRNQKNRETSFPQGHHLHSLPKLCEQNKVAVPLFMKPYHGKTNTTHHKRLNNPLKPKILNSTTGKSAVNGRVSSNLQARATPRWTNQPAVLAKNIVQNEIPNKNCRSNSQYKKNEPDKLTNKNVKNLTFVKSLVLKGSDEILLHILDDRNKFLTFITEGEDWELMAYVLIAVGKAISSHMNQLVSAAVYKITSSENFFDSMSKYLMSFHKNQPQQIHLDSLISLSEFMMKFQVCVPSSASESLIILMPLLRRTCDVCLSNSKDLYEKISEVLSEIEDRNDSFLKKFSPTEARQLSRKEKLGLEEPPDNFRSISILPCADDFLYSSAFIRPNVVNGRYHDTEHYLDVQFRLLREDYIRTLRDGVMEYKELIKNNKSLKNCKNVKVYKDVCIVSQQIVSSGLIHIAQFKDKLFSHIKWEYSKRFMSGSLLCLSHDNFENMLFATVAERKVEELRNGKLMLRFEELTDEVLSINPTRNFVILETTAYFEAYRHNLKALSELDEKKLPMQRYIVEVEKDVLKPKYLEASTTYDMRPLLIPLNRKYIKMLAGVASYRYPLEMNANIQEIPVLNESSWPSARELNLDQSQYDALKSAVTKEFAVIQGPPGTGKTYIGLRIVQLLLHNISKWKTSDGSSTILVVCYTNHALDQFLEGLTLFTRKIVRIGGRGQNESLQQYQLNNLKKIMEKEKKVPGHIHFNVWSKLSELRDLEGKINTLNKIIEKSSESILSEVQLRKVMSSGQIEALEKNKYEKEGKLIPSWLGTVPTETFDSEYDIQEDFLRRSDFSVDMRGNRISNIKPKINMEKIPGEWHKLQENNYFIHTIADQITQLLNFIDPLPPVLFADVQNLWTTHIIFRWKLYKYWIQCFIEKNKEYYLSIERELLDYSSNTLERSLKRINETIHSAFSTILTEFDLRKYIPNEHFASLRAYGDKVRSNAPIMFFWLQLKVENQRMLKDRIAVAQNLRSVLDFLQNENKILSSDLNGELDDEEYEDVEHIEAMRNFDNDEYADVSFDVPIRLKKNETNVVSNVENWQFQGGKKALRKYIKKNIRESAVMSEAEVNTISNMWDLPLNKRWELYKYWVQRYTEIIIEEKYEYLRSFREKYKELCEIRSLTDIYIAKTAHVVGITTTGAAKYKHIIESLNPAIVVVEEAAEILESHIVTSLASQTKHVILIGDHLQLKPSPTVHMLAVRYDLNISLFERMVKNGLECKQLKIQHRMRPEIASLLVPHIYKSLENHQSVSEYENIRGVANNVYFISHSFKELQENDSKSKVNQHEAVFLINLCKYFIRQNYEPSQITILTTYTGQMFELKKLARGKLDNVRITVVDNYQGEENEIILVSFVRSNETGEIGFLKVSNRVCVALSRAKKGLFCIGNFKLLAEISTLWAKITTILEENDLIGTSLELKCQNHPNTSNFVANKEDFDSIPEGGCFLDCDYRLECGHVCPLKCHPFDRDHLDIRCYKPCARSCDNGHLCKKKCYMKCGSCYIQIPKILPLCNHEIITECCQEIEKIKCPKPCDKLLPCKHRCLKTCSDICTKYCEEIISIVSLHCGHKMDVKCCHSEDPFFLKNNCMAPCNNLLSCKHICSGSCGECAQGLVHVRCLKKCNKTLACGHPCESFCSEACGSCEILINKKFETCNHEVKVKCCDKSKDIVCTIECERLLKCGHSTKTKCSLPEKQIKCTKPCERSLPCGHRCLNLCGEVCNTKCEEKCLITSPYCGHEIFDVCFRRNDAEYLSNKCLAPCNVELSCQHTCAGTCSSCHQGRYHVACHQKCKRSLICGHKCASVCSKSCPPCERPCEYFCDHKKCLKKCSEPCEICTKPCTWICPHKRCTKICSDLCDRAPCNEPCPKLLDCKHPCIGFCGEPCPKLCKICNSDDKTFFEPYNLRNTISEKKYVCLEDCGHVFEVEILSNLMKKKTIKYLTVESKTCPDCKTTIKRNNRFGNSIKSCLADIERVKKLVSEEQSSDFQDQIVSILTRESSNKTEYSEIIRCMLEIAKSKRIRHIQEVKTICNFVLLITIFKNASLSDISFVDDTISNSCRELKSYIKATSSWIMVILRDDFLTASELQLSELSWEIHRLKLACLVLKLSSKLNSSDLKSLSILPILQQNIMTYTPFRTKEFKQFVCLYSTLKYIGDHESYTTKEHLFSVNGFSTGKFCKCIKGHVFQVLKVSDFEVYENSCSVCEKK